MRTTLEDGRRKKLPRPEITMTTEDGRRVLRFAWERWSFEMFDDEALVMSREICDVVEQADRDEEERQDV